MNKIYYIIFGIIILIFIYFIYKFIFTKQNFQINNKLSNFKLKSKLKDNLKNIIEEQRKIVKDKLDKKFKNKKVLRSLRSLRSLEDSENENKENNDLFKKSIGQSVIGKSIYLRECNFIEPKNVVADAKYYIFRKKLPVGEVDPTTNLKKIVDSLSYENTLINKTTLSKQIKSNLSTADKTDTLIEKISTEITASVGGSYNKLSVNASFSYLTSTDSQTTKNFQSANLDIEKNSGTFLYDSEFYMIEENYNQEFLDEFIYLASQDPQNISTDTPFKVFFKKYGTHFIKGVDLGKKFSQWSTIESSDSNTKDLLAMKACVSVSFGDYQACKKRKECTENYEYEDSLKDIDWNETHSWDPLPVPGTEDLQPETSPSVSTTTTTTSSPMSNTTTSSPKPSGKSCRVVDDECASGEYCKDYQFPEFDAEGRKTMPEIMGKCYNKSASGFGIGMSACVAHTESTEEITKVRNTTENRIICGGTDEAAAGLADPRTQVSESKIIEFLTSSDIQDVPISYYFEYIWEPFRIMNEKFKDSVDKGYRYKIGKIITGCKKVVNLKKENSYINDLLNKYKFNNEYETIICCADTSATINYLTQQKRVNLIKIPATISSTAEEENDYFIYDINELLPKIILQDIEATLEDFPEAQVKGKKLFAKVNKNYKNDIKIELRTSSENDIGNSNFTIRNVVPVNNVFINDSGNTDYNYLNFKIIFNAKCEDYGINLTNQEFTFKDVLKIYFFTYDNDTSSIDFEISCKPDYGIDGRNITEYNFCDRVGNEINLGGKKYYDYIYTDENLKKNYIELCVPDSAVIKYYNPTEMYKAAINIRTAYIYDVVCPKFSEKTLTNTTTGYHRCDNTVSGTLICKKGYITGISSGYGRYADSIGIKCSSGENYGYGNNNGGFGGELGSPSSGRYDYYKEIPSPEGFRGYASNYGGILDNVNFYGPNLEHKGMIGSSYGDAGPGEGTCPEGQLLVGFNLQKGCNWSVLKSIQGICRKQPPKSEGIVCDI